MAENKMNEVAKLLGVELEEEFRVKNFQCKFKISKDGLKFWSDVLEQWTDFNWLQDLLTGEREIIKLPKSILTKSEKEYLSAVIRPFRDRIIYIKKREVNQDEYIRVFLNYYAGEEDEVILLPSFKKGTMYKGMKIEEEYTLEELEL